MAEVEGNKEKIKVPCKHAYQVYNISELHPGAHVARHTKLWYDEFSHYIIKEKTDSYFSYYECVPVHKTSNVAQVRLEHVTFDRLFFHDFFSCPVFIIHRPEYDSTNDESLERAEEVLKDGTQFQCDGVFSVWNFYSSEIFVFYCKTGTFKQSWTGIKSFARNPMKSFQRSDRYDLERDLGKRDDTFQAEVCATAVTGVFTGVKQYTKEGPAKMVATSAMARISKSQVMNQIKENAATKSFTGRIGRVTARGVPKKPTPTGAAATAAIVAIPVTIVETGLDVKNRWKNIDSLVEEGIVEEEKKDYYRKKYAAMSISGNSVNCGCIIGGAAAGAMIPVPIAGVVAGAVGGAVVGAIANFGTKRVVGKVADRLHEKENRPEMAIEYTVDDGEARLKPIEPKQQEHTEKADYKPDDAETSSIGSNDSCGDMKNDEDVSLLVMEDVRFVVEDKENHQLTVDGR